MLDVLASVTAFIIALLSYRILSGRSRSVRSRKYSEEMWVENVIGKDVMKRIRHGVVHLNAEDLAKYLEKVSLNYDDKLSLVIDKVGRIKIAHRKRRPTRIDYSTTWNLLGFLFSHKMRNEIYAPVIEELKEDLLIARVKCRTRTQRRWIQLCFGLRTFGVLQACIRVATGRLLGRAIPNTIRQWFSLMR